MIIRKKTSLQVLHLFLPRLTLKTYTTVQNQRKRVVVLVLERQTQEHLRVEEQKLARGHRRKGALRVKKGRQAKKELRAKKKQHQKRRHQEVVRERERRENKFN